MSSMYKTFHQKNTYPHLRFGHKLDLRYANMDGSSEMKEVDQRG